MKCESCDNPATVHLTTLTGGKNKKSTHLCEECARKMEVITPAAKTELNLSAIVHKFLEQNLPPESEELARLICPHCGIKYMEFRQEGRLGCPYDYEVFRSGLEPILRRVHRATRHQGKSPPNHLANREGQAELYELHRQLRQAIDSEDFEQAALLRDRIRTEEAGG